MLLSQLHKAIETVAEKLNKPADQLVGRLRDGRVEIMGMGGLPIAVLEAGDDDTVGITWIQNWDNVTFERAFVK